MLVRMTLLLVIAFFGQNAGAKDFAPFTAGLKHPFVGNAAHTPGQGASPLPARALDAPKKNTVKKAWRKATRLSSNPLYLAALYYRNFLTKVDGPRCAHAPTCSHFANQAVGRFGPVGILMGLERLIRSGRSSSVRWLPEIGSGHQRRFFDPVENYIIWQPERFTGFQPVRPEQLLLLSPIATEGQSP
ncbi:MAG: hypothetical protein CMH56_00065 [Myxococcales bacterium]|mgnify:CR=1 FL=1|nr:hypothetical protein [Myxococcales bacterium]|tara:strand:- start:489 stop:1052 length:564 start_codon:yes stop_codon:yes gene_type:complete